MNSMPMDNFDYDEYFDRYIKCFMDEVEYLEEISQLDPYKNSQEFQLLKYMIEASRKEREEINFRIMWNGFDPIPQINFCNVVGNC